jgi:hypothetical protein
MPVVSFQLSTGTSGGFASEHVRLLCLLLVLLTGLPRSMTEASDIFLLCEPITVTEMSDMFLLCEPVLCIGSRFSTLGEPRRSDRLEGDAALNGFEIADSGVGNGFGDRRVSIALCGVMPPDVIEAGFMSWVLLGFEVSRRGAGEPLLKGAGDSLRDAEGDFGGTSGGISTPSRILLVSTFKAGFTPGLNIGDNGFPTGAETSILLVGKVSIDSGKYVCCCNCISVGPVTQAMRASPNGPALQLVPGALLDLS